MKSTNNKPTGSELFLTLIILLCTTLNYTITSSKSGTKKKYHHRHVQRPQSTSVMVISIVCLVIAWCCQVSGGAPPLSTAGHTHITQDRHGVPDANVLASMSSMSLLASSGEEEPIFSSLPPSTSMTKQVDVRVTSPLLTLVKMMASTEPTQIVPAVGAVTAASASPPPPFSSPPLPSPHDYSSRGRSLTSDVAPGDGVVLSGSTFMTFCSDIYMNNDLFDTT